MTRLAWYSPLPPSASGIAQYSAELLPHLAAVFPIDAVIPNEARTPDLLATPLDVRRMGAQAARPPHDALNIYQLGNNPEHAAILELAERVPGIGVLHDITLQHVQVWRALQDSEARSAYRAEMATRYGEGGAAAADDLLGNRGPAVPYGAIPLCERVIERSLVTVVHSAYARALALALCPTAEVVLVPQAVPLLPTGDRRAARARLGLSDTALVVAAVGNVIPEKRLEVGLRAFARALYGLDDAVLVVAGATSAHYDPQRMARAHGLGPVTRWLGHVDATTFEAVLCAADLCLNLRWPTGGETSASFLRMLAAGRATIVSAVGSFTEAPDEACIKVPVGGEAEEAAIVRALLRAADDPASTAAIGARARDYIAAGHGFDQAVAGYRAAIERAVAR